MNTFQIVLGIIRILVAGSDFLSKLTRAEFGAEIGHDGNEILSLVEGISAKVGKQLRLAEIIEGAQGRPYTEPEKAEVAGIADDLDDQLSALIAKKRAEQA